MSNYTFATALPEPIEQIRPRIEAALKAEGFGVLTEIDVAATLKAKLGLERAPYLILGACSPQLAHRALEIDPSIGALLPCNVVLRASGSSGTIVEIIDPQAVFDVAMSPGIAPIATEASERLRRVLDAIMSVAPGDRAVATPESGTTSVPGALSGR